ncbi:MAG: efflux RND transporter permease subunit [Holosporaceae bacterium]|jgi:multidrug efflux pump|nr:efflux RND transporter permease subunit [Holosporaceae bacterium]
MEITEFCIRRPVFSTVLTMMILVLGIVCQSRLPVRKEPKIERSVISVESEFRGASPRVVEAQITKILESYLATIPGAELITSNSSNDKSDIRIEFSAENRTPDGVAADVRDRVSQARGHLPHGIPETIIRKDSSDTHAGITIGFTSDRHSVDDLRDFVERYVKSRFEVVPGVGRVSVTGGNIKSIRIFLDPQRLAAYGYTPVDVYEAIQKQHVQKPCGRLISKDREYMLILSGELTKPQEFDEIVLSSHGKDKVVRIKDVGKSKLVSDDIRDGCWFNGQECVCLSIVKQSTANPIDLSVAVNKIMPAIKELIPSGSKAVVVADEARDINASMSNVYRAIFESTVLVILVVFLFLWSLRATLIPIVTIPVSLLGTFALLYMFDFSINTFTMLAMVLAVGLVVDDAIVVLENVHRHLEKGLSKLNAAIVGSKEIYFSVIAMTLTLATAYIPIAMTPGELGKFFREFALTLSGAVLISGFVAITLSPMMCSKLLSIARKQKATGFWKIASDHQERILRNMEDKYVSALDFAIEKKRWVLGFGFIIACLGMLTVKILPSESKPVEDIGYVQFRGNGPIGASYEFMKKNADKVDAIISKTPCMQERWVMADTSEISGFVKLVDWSERDKSAKDIAEYLTPELKAVSGVPCSASSGMSDSEKEMVTFVLQTNQNYEYLSRHGNRFLFDFQEHYPGVVSPIKSTLVSPQQEYVIEINRDKAASLGVDVYDIVTTIGYLVCGEKAGNVQREAKRDELFIQSEQDLRRTPEDLSKMMVKSKLYTKDNETKMVPVTDMITIRERQSPMGLHHYNQMLSIQVFADIAKGYNLGRVIDDIEVYKLSHLPDTIQLTFAGATRTYLEENQRIILVFALALIFVFLVLAAQFESFIDPFTIMLSVPFSITGALITLYIVPDCSLNIYSKVGLVTLIGLITKHGILIVDFANTIFEEGASAIDAVKQAAHLRLRPILMTTFAMVIGSVPLALASGAGAASRKQIGWAIVGGMSFGTLFTLFIVPIVYIFLARLKQQTVVKTKNGNGN